MKNQEIEIQKNQVDEINLSNVKFDFSKDGKNLSSVSNKSLYKGTEKMTLEEKRKFRRDLRKTLSQFVSQILGRNRSNEERKEGIKKFLVFYRENWIVTDFRIETFSEKRNEADLKDFKNLLSVVSQSLGK
jgi:hypothetical protein